MCRGTLFGSVVAAALCGTIAHREKAAIAADRDAARAEVLHLRAELDAVRRGLMARPDPAGNERIPATNLPVE